MKERLQQLNKVKEPWMLALLFAVCIPLLPEYFAPLLAGGSLLAAYYDAAARGKTLQFGTFGKCLLAYIVYMALGLFYTRNPLSTLATVAMWTAMLLVYIALTTVLTDGDRLDTAFFGIAMVAGLVGFVGCAEYMFRVMLGWDVPMQFWGPLDQIVLNWFPIDMLPYSLGGSRASSTFTNPNIFAEYLVMALPFAAYYSFYGKHRRFHLVSRLSLLLAAAGIAFSFSRSSYMALLAITLVFCIANIRKIMLAVTTLTSVMLLLPDAVINRLFSLNTVDTSINIRVNIWSSALQFFKENPLLGVGAGIQNSWDLLISVGVDQPHMHNLLLQLLIEGGLVAVILFGVLGMKVMSSGISLLMRPSSTSTMLGVTMVAFTVGFGINSLGDYPLMTPKLVGIFLMTAGLFESVCRIHLGRDTDSLRKLWDFRVPIAAKVSTKNQPVHQFESNK